MRIHPLEDVVCVFLKGIAKRAEDLKALRLAFALNDMEQSADGNTFDKEGGIEDHAPAISRNHDRALTQGSIAFRVELLQNVVASSSGLCDSNAKNLGNMCRYVVAAAMVCV